MLYNESTGKPKIAYDIFSLEGLIAWLEMMPAHERYCYSDSGNCVIGQWLRHIDFQVDFGHGNSFSYIVNGVNTDFDHFREIVRGKDRCKSDKTFGAALTRARTALASQSKSEA